MILGEIRHFFTREPRWALLSLLVLALYAWILFFSPEKKVGEVPSEALEKLRLAELRVKEEIRSVGSVREFLAGKPGLLQVLNLFTFVIFAALAGGLILDGLWLLRRRGQSGPVHGLSPPEARTWDLGTLFKIVLLFLLGTFWLHVFLFLIRASFFPKMSPNWFILAQTTLSDLLCVGLVVYFVQRMGGHWRDLGFRFRRFWKEFGMGLVGYLAVLPIFFLVLLGLVLWAHWFAYEPPPHPLVEVFLEEEERAPGLVAYSIFLACVAGPFFEEIFFRGFCYPAFKKRWGVGWALVLSSAFFGLIHQNMFAFWPIFVLGLCLAYLYERRGNLIPSITLHIVHNSVFIAYFFLVKEVLIGS